MVNDQILHGGDYNPEQWLQYPEILEEDLILMKKANVNCVSLGIFSWSVLEPEEGRYDFSWLETIIERLYENGIRVILATPSGAMPHWLTAKYPEVMQTGADGRQNLPGRRHNFCYTSPVMRAKIHKLDEKLSERFGKNEAVILWHISNEFGGNWGDGSCHCPLCQQAFRGWLKEKYGTLDKLNHAWWNAFWSHTYTDWDQIHSPAPHGEPLSHGLNLDWRRFVTAQISDFCREEIRAVRTHSDLPVTTNFMGSFKNLNYQQLHRELDVVSWDNYPLWHIQKDEVPVAVGAAANHNIMRSLKKQPFLMMESSPSCVNWSEKSPLKRPGMHALSSLQAIAHGSDSVQYFQWRKGRGAYEKFHGAVIDHKGGSGTRVFREVSETGARLSSIEDYIRGTVNRPKAAIVFDWENWWALEDVATPWKTFDYVKEVMKHYQMFWENGIDADFISMEDPLDGYLLVCAPVNYMYREGYADKVRQYVLKGGHYLTTYCSGIADDTDLCFIGHHPLEDVLGLSPEETDASGEGFENSFLYEGTVYATGSVCDVCHPSDTVKVLSSYQKDYYAGCPAVTENAFGEGLCYYLAAETGFDFLRVFYKTVFTKAGLENPLGVSLPYGVTVTKREGARSVVFVMNFRSEPVEITGCGTWKDVETGSVYHNVLSLEGFSCKVLINREQE